MTDPEVITAMVKKHGHFAAALRLFDEYGEIPGWLRTKADLDIQRDHHAGIYAKCKTFQDCVDVRAARWRERGQTVQDDGRLR